MALVKCPDCGRDVSDQAPTCPGCGRPVAAAPATSPATPKPKSLWNQPIGCAGCLGISLLLFLGWCGITAITTMSSLEKARESAPSGSSVSRGAPPPAREPALELQSWSWHEEHSFAIAEGQVKNVSAAALKNVQAQVSFFTKDRQFITAGDAMIDFNPILPGQVSPFKVMEKYNPAMTKATITFKELFGPEIAWRDKPPRGPAPGAKPQ